MAEFTEYLPVPGITGTDGQQPVYNPNSRWGIWNKKEIYTGGPGLGRYVPKVGDLVLDQDYWIWYEVQSIDEVTYVAVLIEKETRNLGGNLSDYDRLLGVGPGTQSDTYRVFVDKSVAPYIMAVDARLKVAGSMCASCKIFKGADLSNDAAIISKVYDGAGTFLGTNVPLELVAMDGNVSVRTVPVCYTTEDLQDGELVTAVFYSDSGHVVSKRQLLIENTSFIRSTDDSVKYIIGISLRSPFMSESEPDLINYPINVPLNGLFLTGVVHYSDGSTMELPVDNQKFSVYGFDNFVSTIVGQKLDIVLKYSLSAEEICYDSHLTNERFITKSYKAVIARADGAYTVKLFGYPNWIDGINGYRMEWFVYNLDRNLVERVTPYVRFNENTQIFDPLLFGTRQRLSATLNLQDVSSAYNYYRHVQAIDVTLLTPGGEQGTNWLVGFEPTQSPQFGVSNKFQFEFINQNLKRLKLDMGCTTVNEWLDRLYYPTKPLVNPETEAVPIVPDFFAIIVGTERIEYELSMWNGVFTVSDSIWHGGTVFVEFFKRTASNDIRLAMSAAPVEEVANITGGAAVPSQTQVQYLQSVTISNGSNGFLAGTGYTVGDVLDLYGGTYQRVAQIRVNSVDQVAGNGAITGIDIIDIGTYLAVPTDPVSVTGGSGAGATFGCTWTTTLPA